MFGQPGVFVGLSLGFAQPIEINADPVHARRISLSGEKGIVRYQGKTKFVTKRRRRTLISGQRTSTISAAPGVNRQLSGFS
jgi:hypothetical protein